MNNTYYFFNDTLYDLEVLNEDNTALKAIASETENDSSDSTSSAVASADDDSSKTAEKPKEEISDDKEENKEQPQRLTINKDKNKVEMFKKKFQALLMQDITLEKILNKDFKDIQLEDQKTSKSKEKKDSRSNVNIEQLDPEKCKIDTQNLIGLKTK